MAIGAAVVAIVGVFGLLAAVIGGPVTIALIALGAIFGTVVFNAVQKLQAKMKAQSDAAKAAALSNINSAKSQSDAVSKYTDDQIKQFADLQDQINKTNRDYKQALADILKNHEDKTSGLS